MTGRKLRLRSIKQKQEIEQWNFSSKSEDSDCSLHEEETFF